ncbi:hypothetical protein O6H91_09G074300 [Diphasiastrum complanatum]|uniref:Uncharacterized protein n=1 Tax=Diphasiastrum complanatum TaxID=34168 RepID=A0ACC2CQU8_DIPCM|nr:hypothetical protein O6H91_09G074300 [Diphasiastrum complanatum]
MALPLSTAEDEEAVEANANGHVGYAQISDGINGSLENDTETPENDVAANGHTVVDNHIVTNGVLNQGRVVALNGMEFHVYGNVQGLELLQSQNMHVEEEISFIDSEEEEEEERQRAEAEVAMRQANQADAARRSAPLPPERCQAILDAMRGISLGGFRPEWADAIPESHG